MSGEELKIKGVYWKALKSTMALNQTQYRSREPFCQNSLQMYCNKNNEEIALERKEEEATG